MQHIIDTTNFNLIYKVAHRKGSIKETMDIVVYTCYRYISTWLKVNGWKVQYKERYICTHKYSHDWLNRLKTFKDKVEYIIIE